MNVKVSAVAEFTSKDAASEALARVRTELDKATVAAAQAAADLRELIIEIRPAGLLTVDEMGTAVGRDRNYIDSVWSSHGVTTRGKQTRVPVTEHTPAEAARAAYERLSKAAERVRETAAAESAARADRNRTVALVYGSKLIGPSALAGIVGVDRNHVLRIARKAGVAPAHRADTRNQYTARR